MDSKTHKHGTPTSVVTPKDIRMRAKVTRKRVGHAVGHAVRPRRAAAAR
jgi:hypothetical protein